MPRRHREKPIERLRSSWTSTDDLEETIAAMFSVNTRPPDNLSGGADHTQHSIASESHNLQQMSPDKLSSDATDTPLDSLDGQPPDKLSSGPLDNLSAGLSAAPLDNLSSTLPGYQLLTGEVVDVKCIRSYDSVQSAHTPAEHLVYTTMWKMLGSREDTAASREGVLALPLIAKRVAISRRNLQRIVRSLVAKFAIEVTEFEDKKKQIPRRYRVWGFRVVIERCRRSGYSFVYRNRNLITLARPLWSEPLDKLSSAPPDNLSIGAPDKLTGGATDNLNSEPLDNLSTKDLTTSTQQKASSSNGVPAVIAKAVSDHFGFVDDDAIRKMIQGCRQNTPDATDEEIADMAAATCQRILRMRDINNPVGMLITQTPKNFQGRPFQFYREERRRIREAQEREAKEHRRQLQAIIDDPTSSESDRQWARERLSGESQ